MDSIHIGSNQRAAFPGLASTLDGIGALLHAHADRDGAAQAYAQVIRELLAILGAPTVTPYPDSYGGTSHAIKHPDSRVEKALSRLAYWKPQLMELGLLSADAPKAAP